MRGSTRRRRTSATKLRRGDGEPLIGIVAALADELATVTDIAGARCGQVLACSPTAVGTWSGPGPVATERAVERLLQHGCDRLLGIGVCGAVIEGLRPGRLVIPGVVEALSGEALGADETWHAMLCRELGAEHPVTGSLVQQATPVLAVADKTAIHRQRGACAIDLESGTVAEMAQRAGLPWIVVRTVVDPVEVAVPPASLAGMRADGTTAVAPVLGALLRRPWHLPAMLRLSRGYRQALRTLGPAVRRASVLANDLAGAA